MDAFTRTAERRMKMAERLIDAEALKESIYKEKERIQYTQPFIQASLILLEKLIKDAPTIEAKPIVHAHWEEHREFYEDEGFEGYYYSCSNCDGTLYGDVEGFNFCHCCGAQMDEKESD